MAAAAAGRLLPVVEAVEGCCLLLLLLHLLHLQQLQLQQLRLAASAVQ
jgi:hypothetical protein